MYSDPVPFHVYIPTCCRLKCFTSVLFHIAVSVLHSSFSTYYWKYHIITTLPYFHYQVYPKSALLTVFELSSTMRLTTCLPPGQTGSPYKWVVQGKCLVWVPFDKELYTSHFFLLVSAGRSTYSSPST